VEIALRGQSRDSLYTEYMSITNDAEAVVKYMSGFGAYKRFIYKDTEGKIDELLHEKAIFTGFKFLSEIDLRELGIY